MIYDQYDEEEEEIFDSSFASKFVVLSCGGILYDVSGEEEEEGEDTAAAVNGLDNASPQASHVRERGRGGGGGGGGGRG